jgi:general secretion pathway protein A
MEYFKILNLSREPFSNSPDPDFFFESRQHLGCLQQLELALRLKRGLNVVVGDVGTGKTTLCRQMIRRFAADEAIETHLILDPSFGTPAECLDTVGKLLTDDSLPEAADEWQVKEAIKNSLFRKGVDENRIVVLIIDEGQKIPDFFLETLRELLNYETNEYKLLQIVIFAQKEFNAILDAHANFADRINLLHRLEPLNYNDTRSLIQFRLNQSSNHPGKNKIFGVGSHIAIYRATGGYPRRIINLCHRSIMAMIIQNRTRAGWFLVRSCIHRALNEPVQKKKQPAMLFGAAILLAALVAIIVLFPDSVPLPRQWKQLLVEAPHTPAKPVVVRGVATPVSSSAKTPSAVRPAPGDGPETLAAPVSATAGHTGTPVALAGEALPEAPAAAPALGGGSSTGAGLTRATTAISEQKPSVVNDDKPPTILGRVNVEQGETLWDLCERVYGVTYSPSRNLSMESIMAANPGLKDPDRLRSGQLLSLPAIPVTGRIDLAGVAWIELYRCRRLEEAFLFLREYPAPAPAPQLIPHWNPEEGLLFSIVLEDLFYDGKAIENTLLQLPARIAKAARPIAFNRPETVFYSDPLMKNGS